MVFAIAGGIIVPTVSACIGFGVELSRLKLLGVPVVFRNFHVLRAALSCVFLKEKITGLNVVGFVITCGVSVPWLFPDGVLTSEYYPKYIALVDSYCRINFLFGNR